MFTYKHASYKQVWQEVDEDLTQRLVTFKQLEDLDKRRLVIAVGPTVSQCWLD